MPEIVSLNQIQQCVELKRTGHVIYKANFLKKRVFYKTNKHHRSLASQMEVGFSGLASRFLKPHLTAIQKLVINASAQITGVLSEYLGYAVNHREGDDARFYAVSSQGEIDYDHPELYSKEAIPVYFLNELPPGFFTRLTSAFKETHVTFDMASLASVLATAYTLEEDDLHKGNFCFYLVQKGSKPHAVFMKIDHDLMMADSVMSHGHARIANWLYKKDAFSITERDLLHFPKLLDSHNHYWPTSKRWLVNPCDPKIYNDDQEMTAFAALSKNSEFELAKWQEFYKHILIPRQLIEEDVAQGFDRNNPAERAQIVLITNAVVARQARLRAVLFSIKAFRDFVIDIHTPLDTGHDPIKKIIQDEIFRDLDPDVHSQLAPHIDHQMALHYSLCTDQAAGFKEKDTPLHTAIRLGDYRYDETWDAFSRFARQKNKAGETPLTLAINQAALAEQQKKHLPDDPRKNPLYIIKHLLNQGIKHPMTPELNDRVLHYTLPVIHINHAEKAVDFEQLMNVLQAVGEDERFTLKMRKNVAICCLGSFIREQANNPNLHMILANFKQALNADKRPELQYIRQLRSELWIIRQIRGLLGGTRTQVLLTELVDDELARPVLHAPRRHGLFSFTLPYGEEMLSLHHPETSGALIVKA